MYDLVIRGGTVVDPSQGIHGPADVAIRDGVVKVVAAPIVGAARHEVDADGMLVTPGLVDIHVHGLEHVSHYGLDLDRACLATGVTTAVDAGTAGRCTWPAMLHQVLEPSRLHAKAFIHISGMGMLTDALGESVDLRWLDVGACVALARDYPRHIVGVKVRQDMARVGESGMEPLRRAVAATELLGLPVMVHVGKTPVPLDQLATMLRPGDIITHAFHGWYHGALGEDGRVLDGLRKAQERGVIFDVGHGAGSFSFPVMEACLEQGFVPNTISSDLHTYSVHGPVYDLPTTMAKFVHLGLSLDEVVRRVTVDAARSVRLDGEVGSLAPGRRADVTVLEEIEGTFRFEDCFQNKRIAERTLVPRWTVLGGEVQPAHTGAPWQ